MRNKFLSDETEIRKAIARGRYMVRELVAVTNMKKYRTLKRNYE